jgi:uncharacterized surface protein with fasciclin (FAS1) repeats
MLPLFFFASCNDDDDNEMAANTITDVVVKGSDFSILEAAVVRAGLDDDLKAGTLTVFAPTDAAFQAAGLTVATVNQTDAATLQSILQYHVVNGKQTAASLPTGTNSAVTTLSGGTIYVTKNNAAVSINGATVTTPDVAASNGVIHVVDKVLMPPTGNLVQVAQADPKFSFLVAAVVRASEGSTNVAQVLSGNGPYTVFAPTNQAFIDAGFSNEDAIRQADPATLTKILTYHVVGARVFSTNLASGNVTTLQGENVTVTLGNSVTVKGASNATASTVTMANVVATNGVIHVIDKVLLPAQ